MTNIKNGTTPGKVTPNEKAAGGIDSTTATSSVSHTDSTGSDSVQLQLQLHLDLDGRHAAAIAPLAARPARPCLTNKPLLHDKPRTKVEVILRLFVMGRNLNRFEAEDHHDHCLHSTVSTLQNDYGIKIARQFETVPCLRGRSTVPCKRYWLDTSPDNLAAARVLLAMLEGRT